MRTDVLRFATGRFNRRRGGSIRTSTVVVNVCYFPQVLWRATLLRRILSQSRILLKAVSSQDRSLLKMRCPALIRAFACEAATYDLLDSHLLS